MRRAGRFERMGGHDRVLTLLLFILLPVGLFGQMTARGLGMGGAYTALARGVHAVAWNPANLGLPDNSKFSFTFISLGAGVWNNSFSKSMYDKYIVGDGKGSVHWTQEDIEDILGHIPDSGLGLNIGTSVRAFSFSIGRFALSFGVDAGGFLQLDKTLFDFILTGNELGKTYDLGIKNNEALGIGMASVSWGQPIRVSFADAFSVGGTARLLWGGAYANAAKGTFSFTTTEFGFDLDAEYEAAFGYLGGFGLGLDLGTAAQFGQRWTVSLGLANVLGSVSYTMDDSTKTVGYLRGTGLTVYDITDDENVIEDSSWTEIPEKISARLPMLLRVGASYETGPFLFTADYSQGFQEKAFVGTTPRFALGAEWRGLSWLPLRIGVAMGGRIGLGTSLGFGIRPGGFVLDVGVMNRGLFLPKSSKGIIFGMEIGIDLQRKKQDAVRIGDF
ncbi:MAG: DUF5723 family protein [bacterium]